MTASTTPMNLSRNDFKILNAVFDPESAPETPKVEVDPILPPDPNIRSLSLLTALRAQEVSAIRLVEACNPPSKSFRHVQSHTEEEKGAVYRKALHILNGLIADHPTYASAYNNRAQLHRWRFGDRGVLVKEQNVSVGNEDATQAITQALRDLDSAIELASPSSNGSVSPNQGRLLAQAWTQRAAIFWGAVKDLVDGGEVISIASSSSTLNEGYETGKNEMQEVRWRHWDKTRFEEEGSRSFFMAGVYGSQVGRAMAVMANPNARLCGNIVKEALRRERCGG